MNIDEDLMRAARVLAESRRVSLGRVLSDLVRKGLSASAEFGDRDGFPVFGVSPNAKPIALEDIKRSEDEA